MDFTDQSFHIWDFSMRFFSYLSFSQLQESIKDTLCKDFKSFELFLFNIIVLIIT